MGDAHLPGRLQTYRTALAANRISRIDRSELPPPVQRWLDTAVPDAAPRPSLVRIDQTFEMSLRPGGRWRPGTAVHLAAGGRPGFAWYGRLRLAPLLTVHVYDALVGDEGFLDARLVGAVAVARSSGVATTRSELQRYLAELPWTPLAALTNADLRWRQTADDAAEVSATVADQDGSVVLTFGPDGLPTGAASPARPRMEGKRAVDRPWRGTYSGHRHFHGLLLPARGEVAWQLDRRWTPYWRGEITDVSFPSQDGSA